MVTSIGRSSVRARAADTANRVVAQFEQMIRSAYIDLYGAAKLISEDPERENMFIESLYEYNNYSDVGVLTGTTLHHKNGSDAELDVETTYIYKVGDVPRGRIIALRDGSLLLCAPIKEGRELAARYDTEALDRILGSSFREDYDFAVFNASTGTYLVNHTSFTSGGYYDALLSMNDNGSTKALLSQETAIAHIRSNGGFYIAQQQSAIRPWGIALVIPVSAVSEYMWNMNWMLYAIGGAALLLIAAHLTFTHVAMRRVRRDQSAVQGVLDDNARMLNDLARAAQVTLFIYHRGQDSLMHCYDGLGLLGDAGRIRQLTTLPAVEAACGLNEGDVERFHDCLSGLKRGDVAEMTLRSALPDREERKLRFELKAHAEDGDVIVCSVRDCTQEIISQGRMELENNYLEVTAPRTVAVWTINVSRNLWHNLYMRDPAQLGPLGAIRDAGWRDFTADLGTLLRDFIYPSDYADHAMQLSIPAIAECYRSGKTEFDMDYRVCTTEMQDYIWHRMHVRLYTDAETGDILANIYVFNVDVEKNAELERGERKKVFKKTLRALSGIYYALYYVDLDNDLCYSAKSYDGEVTTKLSAPYRETFDRYLEAVHPDDREALRTMLDAFTIRRVFNENQRFQRAEYRRRSGEEYRWAAIIIQPARFENGRIKDVVIAMRHLTAHHHELDLE